MENKETLVPFLKKDAIVPIKIGTGFVQQLGLVMTTLTENKSQKDLEEIQKRLEKQEKLEPWMLSLATIQTLIRTIYEEGEKLGMVEHRPLSGVIQENLLDDPTPQ